MSLRTRVIALASACLAGLAFASAASAATLSVSVEEVSYKQEWRVTVAGQTEEPSMVQVHVADADAPCSPDFNGPYQRIMVPAGPFSSTVTIRDTSGTYDLGTRQVVCGFVYYEARYGQAQATASVPVASTPPKRTVSANGNNVLDLTRGTRVAYWSLGCGNGGSEELCDMRGSGSISVSAATRRRLGLPSTVIAKGKIFNNGPQAWQVDFDASRAAAKRLRKAASLPVVFRLALEEPFARTIVHRMKVHVVKPGRTSVPGLAQTLLDWDETGKRIHPRGDGADRGGRG